MSDFASIDWFTFIAIPPQFDVFLNLYHFEQNLLAQDAFDDFLLTTTLASRFFLIYAQIQTA